MAPLAKLTQRAQQVAELVALGMTNKEIATRLFVSERTVEWHLEQIFNKLGFTSRSQVAAWVVRSPADGQASSSQVPPRGNLPAQLTSFVGRDGDLRSLLDLVTANRLVTVTGHGGTGKTRLALRLAEELQPDFTKGTWLCDLASVTDASLVGDAVAQGLGINRTASDRLAAVRQHLQASSVLLVLDNCEHLLNASADVARDLLAACPGLHVLATSRRALGVIGEAVYQLDPLEHDDAVRLFVQRAKAAAPSLQLDTSSGGAVATICRHLDGVPLAIELVVPRLRVQSAGQLAVELLDSAWQVHSDARHGSLRALADWSYRLLEPNEQSLFRRLAVFAGWFEAEDAAAVALLGKPIAVSLGALVEHSMLVQEQTPRGMRYRLHEILRVFALGKLEEARELETTRRAHADRMVWLVEGVDFVVHEDPTPRPKVTARVDDVRAALVVLVEVDPRRAAWLCATMMNTWIWSGRALEGLRWSDVALAVCPDPSPERCWILFEYASALAELGRQDEARTLLAKAEALAETAQHASLGSQFLITRAMTHERLGDHASATSIRQEAIQAASREGDEWALSRALNHTAMSMLSLHRPAEARELARRSIEIKRRLDPARLLYVLDTLAMADTALGELDEAKQCWLETLEQCRDTGWGWDLNSYTFVFGLALVAGLRGKNEIALKLHYCAARLMSEINGSYNMPTSAAEAALAAHLEHEVGAEAVPRLRAEGEALTAEMAMRLSKIEG